MRPGFSSSAVRGAGVRALAIACFCMLFATLFASPALAQSQRSVDVRLEIFGDLSITKLADMDFGNVAGTVAGTVVMTSGATQTCTASAGLVHSGTCKAGTFGGFGETGRIVRIKKPASAKITLTGPGADMEINNLIIDGSPQLTLIQQTSGYSRFRIDDPAGLFEFRIAGTLNVGAAQTPGTYTGTFQVDIQYN